MLWLFRVLRHRRFLEVKDGVALLIHNRFLAGVVLVILLVLAFPLVAYDALRKALSSQK